MTTTPDLGIPELVQSQANPDITHNEALVLFQALALGVIDKDLTAPPGSPTEGDSYLINTASPTGAWAGHAYAVAIYWGASWRFVPGNDDAGSPITMGSRQEGLTVFVKDENEFYTWRNSDTSPATYEWSLSDSDRYVRKTGDTMTGRLTFNSATESYPIIGEYSGAGATGPGFALRHTTPSPAISDTPGNMLFQGKDDAGTTVNYAGFAVLADAVVAGGVSGRYQFNTARAGSYASRMQVGAGVFIGSPTGTDKGIGTLNLVELYANNNLVVDTNGLVRARQYTVATLPAAGTAGRKAAVTNALAPAYGAAVAGGGAVNIPVYDNGANWVTV